MAETTKAAGRKSSAFRTDERDKLVRAQIEKERAQSHAKTARLRALRLAKEAADKADQEALRKLAPSGAEPNAKAARRKRVIKY